MNIEAFRNYCLSKPGTSEGLPFDENTLVFKVGGKIFAITDIAEFESINLKCDPELAVALRAEYPAVMPGYHMNKKHWNTVDMHAGLPDLLIKEWIDHSYTLVYNALPKSIKSSLE
ncbi:MAG: MmcQ/YjbR family DNA-binding protein [Cyclobacteriaceae bacterium]